jgi:hypothetical protein
MVHAFWLASPPNQFKTVTPTAVTRPPDAGENGVDCADVALIVRIAADAGEHGIETDAVHRVEDDGEQEIKDGDRHDGRHLIKAGDEKEKEEDYDQWNDRDSKPKTGLPKRLLVFLMRMPIKMSLKASKIREPKVM